MARPNGRDAPRASSDAWPTRPCSDPVAEIMRLFAVNLMTAMEGMSLREVTRRTGVDHRVVRKVLDGTAWVEGYTLARLEVGLGVGLWPRTAD